METNTYATQSNTAKWFEVQTKIRGRWYMVTDLDAYDDREDAMNRLARLEARHPESDYRVAARRGLIH
jgi:hypothetical protein